MCATYAVGEGQRRTRRRRGRCAPISMEDEGEAETIATGREMKEKKTGGWNGKCGLYSVCPLPVLASGERAGHGPTPSVALHQIKAYIISK